MSQGAALLFLDGLRESFADGVLSDALEREHFEDARYRLSRLALLDGFVSPDMTPGGRFTAMFAADILAAFNRHAEADPVDLQAGDY